MKFQEPILWREFSIFLGKSRISYEERSNIHWLLNIQKADKMQICHRQEQEVAKIC
jgi:hypothetical protein